MTTRGPYLDFMRKRFDQRNDRELDPVPWHLDSKETAYQYVEERGFRAPRRVQTVSARDALVAGLELGDRFVVKQPNRHSTKGVYVLETLGSDQFLDLFTLTERNARSIVAVGKEPDYWLAEECLDSGIAGRPVPLDYKIYTFRGHVTHVVQIDRNAYPPRIAVFDGTFMPLVPGKDYVTDVARWRLEHHVLPRHAGALLEMARELSASVDTRFVRVDTYDTPSGPVFGEFTFASGPDDVGMLTYSDRIVDLLDRAMGGEVVSDLSGFGAPTMRGTVLEGPSAVLERLASGAIEGDTRYAAATLPHVVSSDSRSSVTLALATIGFYNGDMSQAFRIQNILRDKRFSGLRLAEFVAAALEFHDQRAATGNMWHASRAAEVRLAEGDEAALATLESLAAEGFAHAAAVVEATARSRRVLP